MAHLTAQPGGPAPAKGVRAVPPARRRSGLPGTLRSEFTKIRSVRSTWLTLAAFVVGALLITIAATASNRRDAGQSSFDPTAVSLAGTLYFGELVIVVTGALVITSEYGTRMIGTSLGAMPRRGVLYAAKVIALAGVTLVVALATSFASFFVGQAVLASTHAGASITSPAVLRAVLFAALFVTCCALLGFGLGAVIRHSAGTIAALFGLLFVVPLVTNVLPATTRGDLVRWLPGDALLAQVVATRPTGTHDVFGPYGELAVFAGYAVIAVAAGALLFRRRDI
jgi:ABC-type transport system involved in multi-copper enzyme maturation permease subunit